MKEDLHDVILFTIDHTSKVAKQYSQREFDQHNVGITVDQWVLLKLVEKYEGLSQTELAEKAVRDPASVTRTLDLLQKKDLVDRNPLPNNRRQYSIALTESGRVFIRKHMKMVDRHRAKSVTGFTSSELRQLKSMLQRIQQNMR